MEYTQFHPTTLYTGDEERFLLTEAIRGEGGVLRNRCGEDFMPKYHPLGSLAPRDIVSRSIMQELTRTHSHYVKLDISHKGSGWIKKRFPMIYQKCISEKIDIPFVQGIPVLISSFFTCMIILWLVEGRELWKHLISGFLLVSLLSMIVGTILEATSADVIIAISVGLPVAAMVDVIGSREE